MSLQILVTYRSTVLSAATFLLLVLIIQPSLLGRVVRVVITERTVFAGGHQFGQVGAYERIRGKLHYEVDPDNPRNQQVVDLQLAKEGRLRKDISTIEGDRFIERVGGDARDAAGQVTFSGDFILLKPKDLSRGNHRILYGVNNRGLPLMLGYYNDAEMSTDPQTLADAGNGWLMRQGYSLLWSAWNWDVSRIGQNPLRIFLPIAVEEDGSPMMAKVNAELAVQSTGGTLVEPIAWGGSRSYPVVEGRAQGAVLTVRDLPDEDSVEERRIIPRDEWQFAILGEDGSVLSDPTHVYMPAAFDRGKLYELIYTAKNPRIVGLGLAAIRDAISFFRFETHDEYGKPNPLLTEAGLDTEFAYIFGISQSGRVITHMLYQGFHLDEENRLVFEGARPQVAGGGKGGFNYRWAQTTHHPKHLEGNYFPADFFPFNYSEQGVQQYDPRGQEGRKHGDVLAEAKRLEAIPKILICNHGLEYWTRSASLVHTSVDGDSDITLHPSVRIYMVNGSRHGPPGLGSRRTASLAQHSVGQVDQRPVGRALLVALDEWVTFGIEPPPSRVPSILKGELITAAEHRKRFPRIPASAINGVPFPALRHPGRSLKPRRVDYGPRFWGEGIQDYIPPRYYGPPFETKVPAFDSDGNGIGGIRLPALVVPLGTNQAFNPRKEGTGAPDFLTPFNSSFWPFALRREERIQRDDPRPSIEERYESQQEYIRKVKAAALKLRTERLILREDEEKIVRFAEKLVWPPEPTDEYPFWRLKSRNGPEE